MTLATAALAPADNPGSWGTFFTLTGTIAATLTGLLFVAFSLRPRDLQFSVAIRTRARHTLTGLVAIALDSALVLMPGQSRAALAAETLIVSAGGAACTVWYHVRMARSEPPPFSADLVGRLLVAAVAWLCSIGAGTSLLRSLRKISYVMPGVS